MQIKALSAYEMKQEWVMADLPSHASEGQQWLILKTQDEDVFQLQDERRHENSE